MFWIFYAVYLHWLLDAQRPYIGISQKSIPYHPLSVKHPPAHVLVSGNTAIFTFTRIDAVELSTPIASAETVCLARVRVVVSQFGLFPGHPP